jgi:flagellar basal-body rod protein FlgG
VDFEDKANTLRKVGHSMYELTDDKADEVEASNYRIDQGFIEESNVNAVEEMVNMLSIMRYFEATQKTMQTLDNVLDRAANQIGRVS